MWIWHKFTLHKHISNIGLDTWNIRTSKCSYKPYWNHEEINAECDGENDTSKI
jgi:hypothetical protein